MTGFMSYSRDAVQGVLRHIRQHADWDIYLSAEPVETWAPGPSSSALARYRFDGFITQSSSDQSKKLLFRYRLPTVDISGPPEGRWPPAVHADNHAIGRLAARHLLSKGLENFAYWGPNGGPQAIHRYEGFAQEIEKAGLPCAVFDLWDPRVPTSLARADNRIARALERCPKPIGVMGSNFTQAWRLVFLCSQFGLRVPEDIAIVSGSGDDMLAKLSPIPVSAVNIDAVEIGRQAAAILDRLMRGGKPPAGPIVVPPLGLTEEMSSNVLASRNPDVTAAIRFIREHATEQLSVPDILKAVPISRRALEKNFRDLLNRSPREQIFHEKVELAKKRLIDADTSLSRLAGELGFSGLPVFSEIFRKHAGERPSEFRRRHRSV